MPKAMVQNVTEYTDGPPDVAFSQVKGFQQILRSVQEVQPLV